MRRQWLAAVQKLLQAADRRGHITGNKTQAVCERLTPHLQGVGTIEQMCRGEHPRLEENRQLPRHGLQRRLVGRRQYQQRRDRMDGLRHGLCQVFGDNQMGVGTTGTVRRQAGDAPALTTVLIPGPGPLAQIRLQVEWRIAEVEVRVDLVGIQRRCQLPVLHLQQDFAQGRDAGGTF
ncbi:hypothetical protein D3C85_536710 [compost metagenome]